MQPGDVEQTLAAVSKSKKILGYNPCMSFDAGIARFVDWLMDGDNNGYSIKIS
jgi:nucleoside-diphosphate-sugar epimerase